MRTFAYFGLNRKKIIFCTPRSNVEGFFLDSVATFLLFGIPMNIIERIQIELDALSLLHQRRSRIQCANTNFAANMGPGQLFIHFVLSLARDQHDEQRKIKPTGRERHRKKSRLHVQCNCTKLGFPSSCN